MEHSDIKYDHRRFSQLMAAKCNDALSEEETRELESIILAHPEAAVAYWTTQRLHSDLEWELSNRPNWGSPTWFPSNNESPATRTGKLERHSGPGVWVLALAGCLLLVASLGLMSFWSDDAAMIGDHAPPSPPLLPEVTRVVGRLEPLREDSRWSFGRRGDWNTSDFREGDTITLDAGALHLQFDNNTTAMLRAPLVMQVLRVNRVRLLRGRMKVDVAEGAEGFTVETSSAEVVDLGTVFSVGAEESGTDVVVLDGEVDLKHRTQSLKAGEISYAEESRRVQAGEAIHISRDGTLSRIVNVDHMGFASDLPASNEVLIRAVKDNIVRDNMWSFYEIVPEGIQEDAKCYVDRGHEWNGATKAGMPTYLLGADYVKTFCDDKITPNLVIELELQEPATVYVFLDNRVDIPIWLKENFEDTGDVIGNDEVDSGGHRLGVGPGNQIDRRFSIWKMISQDGGTVYLGPNGETTPEQQARGVDAEAVMYGIAAKRLDGQN